MRICMETMTQLYEQMEREFRTEFRGDRRRMVFGEGPESGAALLLIGEAPGAEEVHQSRPFVGKAGKNLDQFLAALELSRSEIRISNVVKVRPTKVSPKGSVSNRPPNRMELIFFIPWLRKEIALAQPDLIVTLGNVPLKALLGEDEVIGKRHGRITELELEDRTIPLWPLYHPASIIYNPSLKETYAQDLAGLKEYLESK